MNISLKPELQRFIDEQIRSGRFTTPEDVIEAGLGRLRGDGFGDFMPGEMDGLIQTAEAQFARGEGHSLEHVREHFRKKMARPSAGE
jgi:putative addiction module CopG family antidote